MKAKALLAAGVLLAVEGAWGLDFNGYFRANAGANSARGGQTCFGLAGDAISAAGTFGNATRGSVLGLTAESWW